MIITRHGTHCMSAVKMGSFKTGKFVIVIYRAFHAHFMLHQNDAVLDRIFNTS